MGVLRLRAMQQMNNPEDQEAFSELQRRVELGRVYGTSAPSSTTAGDIYYKIGASASDAVVVYIKVNGTWYGG